jgi:agmatinase
MFKVLGIPYDGNSSFMKGPALAPPRIRQMDTDGSANAFSENGTEVKEGLFYKDLGDLSFPDSEPANAFTIIRKKILDELAAGDKILCLGGDHSVSYPVIDAFTERYPDLNILHLDAHADLYENFDDNPYSHASPFARILEKGKIKSLTQVGIRTLNTHQRKQAEKFGVKIIEMKDFSMNFIHKLNAPLYISLDLDVLDPACAPGVSHHEPGGLFTREVIRVMQSISIPVAGADIVEYNPVWDINNMTAMTAYKLMKEILAKMAD